MSYFQEPLQRRKQKLHDALRLQQLFRDIEDEDDWIREKEPIAASTNRGFTLVMRIIFVSGSQKFQI